MAALSFVALGLAGCSNNAPPRGATQIGQTVVVAYKPCPGNEAAIEQLALYGSNDPDVAVWEAQRQPDGIAVLDMPVRARYPGYDIIDRRRSETLDPLQRYSFEATATDDTEWGGPGFSVDELAQGKVRIAGEELAFREWVDSPTACPKLGVFDAVLTGFVVAGVAALFLLVLRIFTRRARRTDPDSDDPLRS